MPTIEPYRLSIPQARLDHVLARLADAQWPDVPDTAPNADGVDPALVRTFVDHVTGSGYDWRAQEAAINALPGFVTEIDGYRIHFLHFRSARRDSGPSRPPLLMVHGWPGGFLELVDAAERLSAPQRFGGDTTDGFDVLVPSLPGYGLSSKPARPVGPRAIAGLFDRLMTDVLGYPHYIAQGGDWGSTIASWLGFESSACAAIHINLHLTWAILHQQPRGEAEQAAAKRYARFMAAEGAYFSIQATKPLTLSYAMADSPLGAAAWIIEKFQSWSDLRAEPLWQHYDRDRLATLIMIYLLTDSFGTATWVYRALYNAGERAPRDARIAKPTGIAVYPREIHAWPRSLVERVYDVAHWAELPRGGHFAAFEEPKLFADDVRAFLGTIALGGV